MSRRITTYESEAAAELKADAQEQISGLFPKLWGVQLGLTREEQTVGVSARVVDTTPYPLEDVTYCLEALGVKIIMPVQATS